MKSLVSIGVGAIYHKYRTGEIVDDDEVALLHLSEAENFQPCSLPMINIRLFPQPGMQSQLKIITQKFATEFLNIAKNIFYKERTEEVLQAKSTHLTDIQLFLTWFKNNYINQKELDAKEVLLSLNHNLHKPNHSQLNERNFSNTALFRNLKIDNLAIPFRTFNDWLPIGDKVNISAKFFDEYSLSKQLAKAIGVAHEVGFITIKEQKLLFAHPFLNSEFSDQSCNCFIKLLTSRNINDIEKQSLEILAKIVVYLYQYMAKTFDTIDQTIVLDVTQQFYLKRGIDSKEKFVSWLDQNGMDINGFKIAIQFLHFFDYFILKNNLSTLIKGCNYDLYDYFSIAISLNGLDKKIVKSYTLQKKEMITQCSKHLASKGDLYAIAHDFTDAFTMRNFLDKILNLNTNWINDFSSMSWKLQ